MKYNIDQIVEAALVYKQMMEAEETVKKQAPLPYNTSILTVQPGGLFTTPGMENSVISTHVQPMGIGSALPVFSSDVDDPRFGFIFGFSDDIGTEPAYPCDDAPTGYAKVGTLTAAWGRVARGTNTIEVDKILHRQRGAASDLYLVNSVLGGSNPFTRNMTGIRRLDRVAAMEMISLGVRLDRKLAKMIWRGTPSANNAGGGYREFPGLDAQIATGQRDADTNALIPSADSYIDDFNYAPVEGTNPDIVQRIIDMEYFLTDLASRTGMDPVTWAFAMRPQLFYEIVQVWPCRYLTTRCETVTPSVTNPVVINDDNYVKMRDAMWQGRYLIINGTRYPVILDDGIIEKNNATNTTAQVPPGTYASHIYMVPLRVRGSFPVLYWQHIDYRDLSRELADLRGVMRQVPFWTEDGRLLWVFRSNSYCIDLQAKVEPRIVLRTPHLAGKIQNIRWTPSRHTRDWDPTSPYWVDGGVSMTTATQGFAVWRT